MVGQTSIVGKIYSQWLVCASVTNEPRPRSATQGVSCGYGRQAGFGLKSLRSAQTGLACDERGGESDRQASPETLNLQFFSR